MGRQERPLDIRNPSLWADVPGAVMWERYKAHLHATVDTIFRPDRPRAVVRVRPEPPRAFAPGS